MFLMGFGAGVVIAAMLGADFAGCIAVGIIIGIVGIFLGSGIYQEDEPDQS